MNNFTICDIDLSADQIFLPVLYGCVFCVGLPANCLALYGLYRLIKADYALPIYIINLLLSDLLHIATLPFWIHYYRRERKWRFEDITCRVNGYAFGTSLYASIAFMCCIAVERYQAIVFPLWFRFRPRVSSAYWLCLAVWVVVVVTQAVGHNLGFLNQTPNQNQSLCLESYPKDQKFGVFQLIVMPFTFLLPILLFGFLSLSIHWKLQSSTLMPTEKRKRIIQLLVLVLLIYILIYGPYHLMAFIRCIGILTVENTCQYESRVFLSSRVTVGILSLSPLVDPFIYIFVGRDFREKLVYCSCWEGQQTDCQDGRSFQRVSYSFRNTEARPTDGDMIAGIIASHTASVK
ncbi:G-protein coupled receptor 4 [Amia ocellicauda]|uniref:G-protein coupled receptor 4 n=1 Tax=Amia ocellicauda TaxID=2972642 RepID=UPI003463A9EB